MFIEIPVPVAEIFDKISILQIKLSNITDQDKTKYLNKELNYLIDKLKESKVNTFLDDKLFTDLKDVNSKLWDLCNIRRKYNTDKNFNSEYINLSHQENVNNAKRAKIKRKINELFNSSIYEEKSFI